MALKKNIAIVLILSLLFSSFAGYIPVYGLETEQTTVKVDIDCEGLNISLSGENLPEDLNAVSDEEGEASFDALYSYLSEIKQWGSETTLPAEEEVVEVTYDINYADAATAEDRAGEENGKAEFEGVKGTFTLKRNENATGEGFVWNKPVTLDAPEAVTFVQGTVMGIPYGKTEAEAEAVAGIKVKTKSDKGADVELTTDEDGSFNFAPYAQAKNRDDVAIIVESEDYLPYEVAFKNFSGKILLVEKFTAEKDVDYQLDGPIKDGFIKEAGDIKVEAIGENMLCTEEDGTYVSELTLTTDEAGVLPGFYVKNANQDVSKEVKESLKIDGDAPVITEIKEVKETEGEDVNFKEDGIYTNKDADLTLQIAATDAGIGIEKVYLAGDDGTNKETYEAENVAERDQQITADFVIAAKPNLAETLSVYISDKLGNVSTMQLIRGEGSTLYIEDTAPAVSDITLDGTKSSKDWYSSEVKVSFDTQDAESGLDNVVVTVNGDKVFEQKYDQTTLGKQELSFTLSKDELKNLGPEDGIYNVTVTASDRCGNSAKKDISFKADTVVPEAELSGAENSGAYKTAPELTISSSEIFYNVEGAYLHVTAKLNGEEIVSEKFEGTKSVTYGTGFTAEGSYEVSAYAVDAAGNTSETTTVSYVIDGTAPKVEFITDDSHLSWNNDDVQLAFLAQDKPAQLVYVEAFLGEKCLYENIFSDDWPSTSRVQGSFSLTKEDMAEYNSKDGTYEIVIKARDAAGNETEESLIIKADLEAPDINIDGAEDKGIYKKVDDLTFETAEKFYSEDGAFIHVKVEKDGEEKVNKEYAAVNRVTLEDMFSGDGTYTVTAFAQDAAGNKSDETAISFTVDSTNPVITVDGFKEGSVSDWMNSDVEVSFKVEDETSGITKAEATINGVSVLAKTYDDAVSEDALAFVLDSRFVQQNTAEDGEYDVIIKTEDAAGNIREYGFTIRADIVNPELSFKDIIDGRNYAAPPVYSIANNDAHATEEGAYVQTEVKRNEDEAVVTKHDSAQTVSMGSSKDKDGHYQVKAFAVDAAGNTSAEIKVSYVVDTVNPSITVEGLDSGAFKGWKNDAVDITFDASDVTSGLKKVAVTINGKSVIGEAYTEYLNDKKYSFTLTKDEISELENEDGSYNVSITAEDQAGNVETKEFVIYADIVNPDTTISGADEGTAYQNAPEITISTSEKYYAQKEAYIHVTVEKDGKEITSEKFNSVNSVSIGKTYTENGFYKVTAYTVDAAGNRSAEKSLQYIIDDAKPEINVPGLDQGEFSTWKNDAVEVKFNCVDKTSGLHKVNATVNGKSVTEDAIEEYLNKKTYSFELTKDMISELINETGEYAVEINTEDMAGNAQSKTFVIKADIVNPDIDVQGADAGKSYQQAPEITVSTSEKHYSEDGAYIQIAVTRDGKEISNKRYDKVNTVAIGTDFTTNGVYEVKAFAVDAAGNKSGEKSLSYIVDNVSPVISVPDLDKGVFSTWKNSEVEFIFEMKDGVAGLEKAAVSINGKQILQESYAAVKTQSHKILLSRQLITSLINEKGEYSVVIDTQDMAGNTAKCSFIIKADIVTPSIEIDGATAEMEYQTPPVLTVSTDEKHAKEKESYIQTIVLLDGKEIQNKKHASVSKLTIGNDFTKNGVYTVKAYAVDVAGNKSVEKSIVYTVDDTNPTIDISGLQDGEFNAWKNDAVTVQLKADDKTAGLKSVKAEINGKVMLDNAYNSAAYGEELSFMLTKALIKELDTDNGKYHVTVTAVDRAGNEFVKKMTIKADIVKPVVTISGVEKGTHYNYSPKVTITSDEKYYNEKGAYMVETIYLDGKKVSSKKHKGENQIVNKKAFKKDGLVKILTYAVDAGGNKSDEKTTSFMIDTKRPKVSITGAEDGKTYAQAKTVTFSVKEKNFKQNDVTVEVTRTLGRSSETISVPWKNIAEDSSVSKTFSATGTYTVTLSAKDRAGNEAYAKSLTFTVDQAAPVINIGGVEESRVYNYDAALVPTVDITDDYYASKTVTVTKDGSDVTSSVGISDNGTSVSVTNIPKERKFDGRYVLTVTATDKAGNHTEKEVAFMVNRFGSNFSYNDYLRELNGKYVQNVDGDIVITERNLSETTDVIFEVTRDGEATDILPETTTASAGGYQEYIHTFNAGSFDTEGVYQINIISTDKAGNVSESVQTAGSVKFFIDKTPPIINAGGLGESFIQGATHEIILTATDNLSKAAVSATVDGHPVDMAEKDDMFSIVLGEGLSQKVVITATDEAGNTETIEQSITVSTSDMVIVFAEYGIFIAGAAVLAASVLTFFLIRRKKRGTSVKENDN